MTIPIERTWSIQRTRNFLLELLDPKKTPRVPNKIRQEARRCLRHFPGDLYIEEAARAAPSVFGLEPKNVRRD